MQLLETFRKPKTFLTFLCPWFSATASMLSTAPLREVSSFNRERKFQLGDHPGAEAAACDDSKWDAIGLPPSFSVPCFTVNEEEQ